MVTAGGPASGPSRCDVAARARTVTADAIGARDPARGNGHARPAVSPATARPACYTTGQLQQLVHLHHRPVGRRRRRVAKSRAGERVGQVLTLRAAGCRMGLLTTEGPAELAAADPARAPPGPASPPSTGTGRVSTV
ncbi:hypothetical protein GCM10020218_097310 [Dactylosporangium vinaceum]